MKKALLVGGIVLATMWSMVLSQGALAEPDRTCVGVGGNEICIPPKTEPPLP